MAYISNTHNSNNNNNNNNNAIPQINRAQHHFMSIAFYPFTDGSCVTHTRSLISGQILILLTHFISYLASSTNWNGDVRRRKATSYAKLFANFIEFGEQIIYNGLSSLFITERAAKYLTDELILHNEMFIDTKIHWLMNTFHVKGLATIMDQKLVQEKKVPCSCQLYSINDYILSATLPPSTKHFITGTVEKKADKQHNQFNHDCTRLGFKTNEKKKWYATTLKILTDVLPSVSEIIEKEIESMQLNENDYRNLDIMYEYNQNTSWAMKLFVELPTLYKTRSPTSEIKRAHDLKKHRQHYFSLHTLYHIRNAIYGGPLSMKLSDVFYTRHKDVNYSFNMFSHLGVTQSFSTVRNRQNKIAEDRNVEDEIQQHEPSNMGVVI